MRLYLLITLLTVFLACAPLSAAQLSIGVNIGPPPAPVVGAVPLRPGPGYVWVDGYWYPVGHHYRWHGGYWTLAPYAGAHWIVPRYEGGRFYRGYWEGNRGRIEHNHHWDRKLDRDYHWNKEHHHEHH